MTALQPTINAASSADIPRQSRASRGAGRSQPAIPAKTWIAVIGATLGAFMAVLNIQIVNASLADIQGAIGAGIDDGGWISTSYLIAEIVVIPLERLARPGVLDPQLSADQRRPVPGALGGLCLRAEPAADDRAARGAGIYRRRADPDGVHADHHAAAEGEAADRARAVRALGHLRARDRPDHRRLSDRELGLGVHLLCQPGARRGDDRHALLLAGSQADEPVAAARGRLGRHRHHGDRPLRAADRAGGRQQGRLVRLALHRQAVGHRRGRADGLHRGSS